MDHRLLDDDRGAMIPVAHVMTITITTILVVVLLVGATGMLDDQRQTATGEELRTVGNRLATDIARVDALALEGGGANVTTRHAEEIAGNSYTATLHNGTECETVRVDANTCIVLSSNGPDVTQTVPVRNDTRIDFRSGDAGVFHIGAAAQSSNTRTDTWDPLDLETRIGISRNVRSSGTVVGAEPGNRPPRAKFTFSPPSPQHDQTVTFDATGSLDHDGNIVDYLWDFDGDGAYEESTGSPTVDRSLSAGTYNITLRVQDDVGATSNVTKFVDVSGLVYNRDIDTTVGDDGVEFSVTNAFDDPIDLTHISIDPVDDSIDEIERGGDEIYIDATNDGWYDEDIELVDGGRILELDDYAGLSSGETATVTIRGFEDSVEGDQIDLGLQYERNGIPNSTTFNDVPAGPAIADYRIVASDTDVDLRFESSHSLDTVSIGLGGDANGTIDRSDLSESGLSGGGFEYSYDVSDGTDGYFWANMTAASSGGISAGSLPVNDSAIAASGGFSWTSTTDWDASGNTSGIVHADFGDHEPDRLELGYPARDRVGNNLVAYWPLDTDDDAPDVSGHGNDGEEEDSPSSTAGLFGTGAYDLVYDESWWISDHDYIRFENSESLDAGSDDAVTISTWVNRDEISGDNGAVFNHEGSYALDLEDDKAIFTIQNGGDEHVVSGGNLGAGQWDHVVGVLDGGEAELYINGKLVDSIDTVTGLDDASGDAFMGWNGESDGDLRYFDGQIDEVRVYNRSLGPGEVQGLYDTHKAGRLVTDWKTNTSRNWDHLELQYEADIGVGESARVRVHSRNVTTQESDWVYLTDGNGRAQISGLNQRAGEYRLEVELTAGSVTRAPSVNELTVVGGS